MGALSEENAAVDPAAVGAGRHFAEACKVRQLQPHEPSEKQLVGL